MAKAVYGSRAAETTGPTYRVGSQAFQTAEDIIPIAELKANMSEIVRELGERPRPLVVTLNGKPAAVVMSPREYDRLSYQSRFIDSLFRKYSDQSLGGATVLVAQNGSVLVDRSYGIPDQLKYMPTEPARIEDI